MSHEQNITTVTDIYDAVARGDVDAILDRVTDDVDWAAEAASSAAPWYGQRSGKDGAESFFGDLASSIEITQFTPHSYAAGDDNVHLLVDWTFRSIATGREASMTMHHYWASRRQSRVLPRQRRHRTDGPGLHRLTRPGARDHRLRPSTAQARGRR